jgi:Flp pilus assembly protein TadG
MHSESQLRRRRLRGGEKGQAMVEFALILFPLLIIVAGVIQFGIGLNFWLDSNRIANQGARMAVVNHWPGCDRTANGGSCTNTTWNCRNPMPTNLQLQRYLQCQATSKGLRDNAIVTVCWPNDGDTSNDGKAGSPVRVRVQSDFKFVPILKIGTITLRGDATMRLEQDSGSGPSAHISAAACP